MFEGHDAYLVALSVAAAILGGYTGFGLAARIRGTPAVSRKLLLAGAAGFLAVGIWTMHFVGMLAAPIPDDAAYLVLPTIVSFLICALVVGVSVFFISLGRTSPARVAASALFLGMGIVSMHYVGIHGLAGNFHIEHDHSMAALAALIAVGTAYGGLRIFLARQGGMRLAFSAVAFGIAVSGMHYTAMYGMHFLPSRDPGHGSGGLVASPQAMSLVLAVLCFLLAAGFLLFLVPEPRRRAVPAVAGGAPFLARNIHIPLADAPSRSALEGATSDPKAERRDADASPPRAAPAARMPVQGADGTQFVDIGDIRSIRADAHYTLIHNGVRERMCPWSISEAEAQLDPAFFLRVHRSHIVSLPHVTLIRKQGDGAVVELDGAVPHRVPVSRARIAELKARLGLARPGAPTH